jgi:hypothetical protein
MFLHGKVYNIYEKNSVLRIRDVYPGSRIRVFSHPGSRIQKQQQKRGVKKFCHTFLCSHKFHKIENHFSFEVLKKKIWANFQRIIELFTQKIVTKLSKIWLWVPGSGKNLFRIPDPGSRGQKGTGSRIPDLDPQHWKIYINIHKLRGEQVMCTSVSVDIKETLSPTRKKEP